MEKVKKQKKQHYFWRSLTYLKPYKGMLALCIISCILTAVLSVFSPIFTEKMVTAFTNFDSHGLLKFAALVLAVELGISIVHLIFWGNSADRLRARVTKDIRYNTMQSILRLKTRNFDLYGTGKLLEVISSDTQSLSGTYTKLIDVLLSMFAKLVLYGYMLVSNWILGVYCIVEFIIICFVYHVRISRRVKDRKILNEISDKNIGVVNETIRGVRDIRNLNIDEAMLNKTNKCLTEQENADARYGRRQYQLFRLTTIVKDILAFAYIGVVLLLIHYNLVSFPTAFTIYIIRRDAIGFVNWFMNSWEYIKDGDIFAKRIFDVMDGYEEGFEEFPEKDEFTSLADPLNIEIKNLSFSYENAADDLRGKVKPVLNNLSIKFDKATTTAIVGESGSGKSTILKLLNRTYDVEPGQIFIGGEDICKFSKDTLRNTISVVSQDPYIFNFTIRENLLIINPSATQKQIEEACKKAQIYDFIMKLPDKFDTVLGEAGTRLSGGQRQRLSIARAFLKNSPVLIFDETTSALDNENQSKIKLAIENVGKDKIVIIVAHRLSTIKDADTIHFLRGGSILASGTHEELMETCEPYKNLYEIESRSTD